MGFPCLLTNQIKGIIMKRINLILIFILMVSFIYSLEYSSILSVSEESLSAASKDSTLYLASLNGLSIYNYTNENLELVNTINSPNDIITNVVRASGNYLIQGTYTYCLYDVTDNHNPVEIMTLNHGHIAEIYDVGDYLLVRADNLYAYNINDFSIPPSQLLESAGQVKIFDNLLFQLIRNTDEHRELRMYTMSLPTGLELIDSLQINDNGDYSVMAIQNERIFTREKNYLKVFSFSNGLELLETFGPLPSLDDDPSNFGTIGNSSTLISTDGYYWDISDVSSITQYQSWRDPHYYYQSKPTIIGDYYIKPNLEYGLVIVNFSDIENADIIYEYNYYYNPVGVEIIDNTLLDVAYPKLTMYDLSNTENIEETFSIEAEDWDARFKSYCLAEDKLILNTDQYINIYNTENGISQAEFSSSIGFGQVGLVASYNDYLYHIGPESLNMQIIDISNTEDPEIITSVSVQEISDYPVNLYIIDNYLILVNHTRLMAIYDLNNPVQPQFLSTSSFNSLLGNQHYTDDIEIIVQNNIAYVSFVNYWTVNQIYLSDIFIFDITDIENWILLNTITSDVTRSNSIEVVGDYLYSVSKELEAQIYMYQLDGLGGFSLLASYTSDICTQSQVTDFDVFNGKLYLCQEYVLSCFDILYYTENDSFEIAPSNEISAYNYPNPFNPETTISYELTNKGNVSVDIYNLKGQKVKTLFSESQEAGKHSLVWRGDNDAGKQVSSGTYLYRVKSSNDEIVKKMLMLK